MQFIHSDLGVVQAGTVVEFTLSGQAAIRLLDNANFASYKVGRRYRFHGDLAKVTPARLSVPQSGHWHAVVDLNGYAGQIRAGISVLSLAA